MYASMTLEYLLLMWGNHTLRGRCNRRRIAVHERPGLQKETVAQRSGSSEFSSDWALHNGIAILARLATPLCNADRFLPRFHRQHQG